MDLSNIKVGDTVEVAYVNTNKKLKVTKVGKYHFQIEGDSHSKYRKSTGMRTIADKFDSYPRIVAIIKTE